MSLEFLILIGVFAMLLDQIRRIRATSKARIAELEAKVSELEAVLSPEVQAELDAFEAELKPAEPTTGAKL